jgi:hypothetical protein
MSANYSFIDPVLAVQDKKLNLTGSLRQQIYTLAVIHVIDKPTPGSDLQSDANKVTTQLKAVIRENRTLPYQTAYSFVGLVILLVIHTRLAGRLLLLSWRHLMYVG